MTSEETITILQSEYAALCRSKRKLSALEAGGVDNWEWYGESLSDFYKDEDEEDDI